MRKPTLLSMITILALCACMAWTQEETTSETWTIDDAMNVLNLGSTAISPDGKWIAFTIGEAKLGEERSEFLTHIWLTEAAGGRSYQLTTGKESCNSPAWSPDGKWIAFTSSRGDKNNIWLIRPFGGEAHQLTDVKTGVGDFKWSHDGAKIAFTMSDPEPEEMEKAKKAKDDARVVDAWFAYSHIYTVPAELPGDTFPEPEQVTDGDFHVANFDWSPDGGTFVFERWTTPRINDWPTADVCIIPAAGGDVTELIATAGADANPIYSPDGATIAFVSDKGDPKWAFQSWIGLVPAAGGEATYLDESYDEQPNLVEWAPDGSGIYYSEGYHGSYFLYFAPADGGEHRCVNALPGIWSQFDVSDDGSLFAFTWQDFNKPEEIYTLPLRMGTPEPTQITNVNGDLPDKPFTRSEHIAWKSTDGTKIEGLLHYPLHYEEGKKYPLILQIHGGPTGMYSRTFTAGFSLMPIEASCAKGFFILRPNPRGSSGYGREFRFANYGDWAGGDYEDLMSGVQKLIDDGMVDPERLGVTGWSYGGYMTSMIITKTDRFKAAIVGAGVTDLVSFSGTADIPGFIPDYFAGESWEQDEVWRAHSALFNVGSVTTPTLILHGENDARVPIGQGYELYNALLRKGVEVQMVVYPRTPHGPVEPKLLRDVMQRHTDWFFERLLLEE